MSTLTGRRGRRVAWVLGLTTFGASALAQQADVAVTYEAVTAGFTPHVQTTAGGRINWTGGEILADGRGIAQGTNNQQKLMARRGAVLDAAANALAIAAGVNVDANGRAGDLRNGRRRLEGHIKGHRVVRETWQSQQHPPTYEVTIRVPLWGVKSVSSLFVDECRLRARRRNRKRLTLVEGRASRDSVLVIDARGTGLNPCLFPTIVSATGKTLFDVNTMSPNLGPASPPVRYVETEMSFEKIQAALGSKRGLPGLAAEPRAMLAAHHQAKPADQAKKPDKSKAQRKKSLSPPKNTMRKKRRRRRAVKAVQADGLHRAKIVLTAADAEKLRQDSKSAGLLRHAEIVVVVDSAAAGIEGRLPANDSAVTLARVTP